MVGTVHAQVADLGSLKAKDYTQPSLLKPVWDGLVGSLLTWRQEKVAQGHFPPPSLRPIS